MTCPVEEIRNREFTRDPARRRPGAAQAEPIPAKRLHIIVTNTRVNGWRIHIPAKLSKAGIRPTFPQPRSPVRGCPAHFGTGFPTRLRLTRAGSQWRASSRLRGSRHLGCRPGLAPAMPPVGGGAEDAFRHV